MHGRVALLLLLAIAASACGRGAGTTFSPNFDSIVLERTGCFGECPAYTVRISANGDVEFKGTQHVEKQEGTRKISLQELKALDVIIEASSFAEVSRNMEGKSQLCGSWHTDEPSVYVTVMRGSDSRRLEVYYGCEATTYLRMVDWVARSIDQLSGTVDWVDGPIDAVAEQHRNEGIIWTSPVESSPNQRMERTLEH